MVSKYQTVRMKKLLICISFLICLPLFIFSQSLAKRIENAYRQVSADSQLEYGLSSLTVLNAKTGDVIFSDNAGTGFASASTLKTVTSITAFNLLGENFTWETTLGYNGTISNGVLNGDLIVTGSGDPTLGSDRYGQTTSSVLLNRWAAAVRSAGIREIKGRIISDDRVFGTQSLPRGWIWQDIGNYYGAGPSALNWKENEFGLHITPGSRAGSPVILRIDSSAKENLHVVNELTTGHAGSGDNVYAYSAPYSDVIYLRGTYGIDLHKTIMAAEPDPAFVLAAELKEKLASGGISTGGPATTVRRINLEHAAFSAPSVVIDRYHSPKLSEVVYWLNKKSINLYAESILKTLAVSQGREATFDDGVDVVKDYWNKREGIDRRSLDIIDGSGLSPENRITTLTMARILLSAKKEPWFNSFYESLPVYNDMKMKSGSISKVLAFAGYQTSSDGTPLVFSFILNHFNGSSSAVKQKMFRMLDVMK